jgi:tetratricopeptide (TPR) repeat protein
VVLSNQSLPDQNRPNDGFLSGSVEDISCRLGLWAKRDTTGIVRIEYSSEFARQRVMQHLKTGLSSQEISLVEIVLPAFQDAETVVKTLITQLEALVTQPKTVVSVTGFATAFSPQVPLDGALRVLNFNRDRYVSLPLKQLWWMTPSFMQSAIHAMPDLNSFFLQRLQLTEIVLPETEPPYLIDSNRSTTNIDDARQRAYGLLRQFETAKTSDANPQDLLNTYVLPALEALAEVGAQKELRDLTQQFEGILSQIKVTDSPELATSLNRLASLYADQGRYSEAEPLYKKALTLRKKLFGNDHPTVATSLNNLAWLYKAQGRYKEAEHLYQEAMQMRLNLLGEAHPDAAQSINNLAALYQSQCRYNEAEPLYHEALQIRTALLGKTHPDVAQSLNNLAGLYESQGRYSEAEPLYHEALRIRRDLLGEAHPDVAQSLNNLATLYHSQGRYNEAELLYQEALQLRRHFLGEAHPDVATSLNNLAALYESQGRYEEAEPLALQSLQISVTALGNNHPDVGIRLSNLASLRMAQGKFEDVETMFLQALSIFVNTVRPEHRYTVATINGLGRFITTVVAAGQTHLLSNNPTTQALLAQIQP